MSAPRFSKAQQRFMDEYALGYLYWAEDVGSVIPLAPKRCERRTFDAMIRKGFISAEGHITKLGKEIWLKSFA